MTSVGAIVLAAGFGTRLAPLTDHTPKPLLHVGDAPVATHLLRRLHELPDLAQTTVVVNDRHVEQWQTWQAAQPGQPLTRVVSNGVRTESERVGAVADLAFALHAMAPADWIIVLAGDNLLDEPLLPHLRAAIDSDAPVVLCRDLGHEVPPGRFGEITMDPDQVITRFREKPQRPQSPYVATCSYILPGDCAGAIETFLEQGDSDAPGAFVGWLAAQRTVVARFMTGRYFDIGNHETLAAARAAY